MSHKIFFGGKSSDCLNAIITCDNPYDKPQRIVETYTVPGHNGDVVIDTGRFGSITRKYRLRLSRRSAQAMNDALRSVADYFCQDGRLHELQDDYCSWGYRLARVASINPTVVGSAGKTVDVEVELACQPEVWLLGVTSIVVGRAEGAATAINPTGYAAPVMIHIPTASSDIVLTVEGESGTASCTVTASTLPITIDTADCTAEYSDGSGGALDHVSLSGDWVLAPGTSKITLAATDAGIGAEILPRWWTI